MRGVSFVLWVHNVIERRIYRNCARRYHCFKPGKNKLIDMAENNNIGASADINNRGATITSAYVGREVKAYAVLESEINTLSLFNTLGTVFFSVGSAFASIAIGILTNASFVTDKLPPEGVVLTKFAVPALFICSGICVGLGAWSIWSRNNVWSNIDKQSKQTTDQPS